MDPYTAYYLNQAGSGISSYYKGAHYQKGRGIGSFLGGLFRSAFPLFKAGARAVGKEAWKACLGILSDHADDKDIKQSFKRRASEAGLELLGQAEKKLKSMSGGGRGSKGLKRTKRAKNAQSKTSRRNSRSKGPKRKQASAKGKGRKKAVRKTVKKRRATVPRVRDIFD